MNVYFFITAQVLGISIFFLNAIGHSKLTTKKVYKYNNICNGLSIIQYCLLGAYSGAVSCFIAVVRNFVFSKFKKKVPFYVLLIYIIIVLIISVNVVKTPFDLIPISNIILYAVGLWTKDIFKIKILGIYTCVSGFIYDFNKKAYASVLNEIVDGVIGVRSLIILKRKKTKR